MDRRHFLAASGLATATTVLARKVAASPVTDASPDLFKRVNFATDGLDLDPREYATLLREATMARSVEADNYSNGGMIAEIEQRFAQLLGKEAAMFVPTGTLANHLAVRKLAGDARRVLVQADSHFYNDSGDCAGILSGLNLVPLTASRGMIDLEEVKRWVERSARGRVETKVGVIAIENPVRRGDHAMVDMNELDRVCRYAREHGIRLHLDGARMFNLPLHSGRSVRDHAALFDTVYVSLWKHFNGTSGAILAGDSTFIDGLFHTRRMFGGSLPQAWANVALAGRYAERYEDDYAAAWQAADRLIALLESDGRFSVRKVANGTSRFFLSVSGVAPDVLAGRLSEKNILVPGTGTATFPMQVNPTITRMAPEALARIFIDSAKA